MDAVEKLVKQIISSSGKNDFIQFEIRKLETIREIRKYPGISIYLIGSIGRVKIPFSIDFGVGDVVIPSPVERTLLVMLPEFEKPMIFTYSLESTMSEKLDAIISLMEATSRMKDFFDIYYLQRPLILMEESCRRLFMKLLPTREHHMKRLCNYYFQVGR